MIRDRTLRQAPSGCVNLGLVGVGRWGSRYLSTLAGVDGVRLALVVSRNPRTHEKVPPDCQVLEDWQGALEPGRLDGLILATPPAVHYEMARACVDSGFPVLVEKPLTQDQEQARDLQHAARRQGSLVMVEHTHLFSSAFETLKRRMPYLAGPLRIRAIGGNYGPFRADADALWDWGPHDVSMCLDLIPQSPIAVRAHVAASRKPGEGSGMVVDARLEFSNGMRTELTFGNLMPGKRRRFEVRGSNGALIYDDLAKEKLVERDGNGVWQPLSLSPVLPLSRAVMAFRDSIILGDRGHPSLPLGVRVVETLARIESELKGCCRPNTVLMPR